MRALIGAGGPREWAADVPWPLHKVLAELHASADAQHVLPVGLRVNPQAGVGLHVEGVEGALHYLARSGELILVEEGLFSSWQVVGSAVPSYRRLLMSLSPSEADALYRAGRRWAALAATSLKKLRTASVSANSTKRSATPILPQVELPIRRY